MVYMQWNITQPQNKTNKHKETETYSCKEQTGDSWGGGGGQWMGKIGDRDQELQTFREKNNSWVGDRVNIIIVLYGDNVVIIL